MQDGAPERGQHPCVTIGLMPMGLTHGAIGAAPLPAQRRDTGSSPMVRFAGSLAHCWP